MNCQEKIVQSAQKPSRKLVGVPRRVPVGNVYMERYWKLVVNVDISAPALTSPQSYIKSVFNAGQKIPFCHPHSFFLILDISLI
jgi:hypothetical protein